MKKIALLSDIHGNLPALKAVIEHTQQMGVDEHLFLGDYITDGPYVNEILDLIKSISKYIVAGNREGYILNYKKGEIENKQLNVTKWTHKNISNENYSFIASLDENIRYSYNDVVINIRHIPEYEKSTGTWFMSNPDIEKIHKNTDADIEVFGHTHQPLHIEIDGKHIINPGAIGVNRNSVALAEYAIINIGDKIEVELYQCDYDKHSYLDTFLTSNNLKECGIWTKCVMAGCLIGDNYCAKFLLHAKDIEKKEIGESNGLISDYIWDKAANSFELPEELNKWFD